MGAGVNLHTDSSSGFRCLCPVSQSIVALTHWPEPHPLWSLLSGRVKDVRPSHLANTWKGLT